MSTKIKDIIDFYTGHEVSEDIKERVFERISGLRDDKDADIALRNLWNQAEGATMDGEDVDSAFGRFCQQAWLRKAKVRTLQIFTWARVAAVVVPLLMLVVFAKIYMQMDSRLKQSQVVAMLQEHTVNGEDKVVTLKDGTKVKLSPSSVLLYPSDFQGVERKVFLTGEAFFDIKHDAKQPFHVSTPYFEITDLGTSFAVSSYTTDEEVSTTLKTGKVELRVVGENKVYSMKPNDQLVYNVKTKAVSIRQVAQEDDGMGWRNKEIDLNDVTLVEAANILSKAYGVKFTFRSHRHQNTKITVHFNRGESISGAMTIVKSLIPGLECEVRKDEVVLK